MEATTRTIAGHEVTLESGKRYIATRPMAQRGRKVYPISIYLADASNNIVVDTLPMDYDEANQFLAEFNNGKMSFDGRVW